jgi:replication factor C subunit 1
MSSGDRSGSSQLVAMIQLTKVPVICICNDREHDKIKTLKSYCVDVPFERPAVGQIVRRIAPICRREKYGISDENISKLAIACSGDLRQVLNMLQMWHTNEQDSGHCSTAQINDRLSSSQKEIDLGPFDVISPLFAYSRHSLETQFRHYFVGVLFFLFSLSRTL